MKNNYGFVLIQPQLGENIGASARSLKNFGFNNLIIEILDGHAKGTRINISLSSKNNQTLCQVNSDVKLSLKTIVLLPILKAEYNVFVSNVFKKMAKNAKEIII